MKKIAGQFHSLSGDPLLGSYAEGCLEKVYKRRCIHCSNSGVRELSEFAKFFLDEWPTLTWNCGFDLDAEFLYELAIGKLALDAIPKLDR
jgi:hypothetical protein